MIDIYQGDPLLFMTNDGVDMEIKGGQPTMDKGLSNFVNISLFTREGWFGNYFINDVNKKVGSKYLETAEKPITITSLNDTRLAGEKALKNPVVGKVTAIVTNPQKNFLKTDIGIQPPGQDAKDLQFSKYANNWIGQALKSPSKVAEDETPTEIYPIDESGEFAILDNNNHAILDNDGLAIMGV